LGKSYLYANWGEVPDTNSLLCRIAYVIKSLHKQKKFKKLDQVGSLNFPFTRYTIEQIAHFMTD